MTGRAEESPKLGDTGPVTAAEPLSQPETGSPMADQPGEAVGRSSGVAVPQERRHARLLGGLAIAGLAAGAVVVVLLLAGSSDQNKARSGALSLSYRSPWRVTKQSSSAGFALRAPVFLSSGQTTLAFGAVENSASVPGGAPPAMVARYGHAISSSTTRVAKYKAKRYVWDPRGGRTVIALVIPTASVDLSLVCDGSASSRGALGKCEALAAGVTVSGATPVAPGVDQTLLGSLQSILAPVSDQRNRLGGSSSSALPDRAQALSQAASVERTAASKLSGVYAPRNQKAVANLRTTLSGEAASLQALSQAAARNDASAYESDRTAALSASRKLTESVSALTALGFTPPSFAQLRLAAAPAPPTSTAPTTSSSSTGSSTAPATPSSSTGTSTSSGLSSGGPGSTSGTSTSGSAPFSTRPNRGTGSSGGAAPPPRSSKH
jgi:hypothetical protein